MNDGKRYAGALLELIDGDVFRIRIDVPDFTHNCLEQDALQPLRQESRQESGQESGQESRQESELATRILTVLRDSPQSMAQIAHALGHTSISSGLYKQINDDVGITNMIAIKTLPLPWMGCNILSSQ